MILFKKAEALSRYLLQQKQNGRNIGFVPTMGALHEGHFSLIVSSKEEQAITVCSIFINPTQFNNPDDFKHYPVTVEEDIGKLLTAGCDVLFLPSADEVYPEGYTAKKYKLGVLETLLEGRYRPGHFQGVCQVVDRLLQIVQPAVLYLGQKDYQQCKVIQTLINSRQASRDIKLKIGPTCREKDGLAMSSRNLRLTGAQRQKAPLLYKALHAAKEKLPTHPVDEIKAAAERFLTAEGFAVDYFEIADADTLLSSTRKSDRLIALVAAHLDGIRLIDNLLLN